MRGDLRRRDSREATGLVNRPKALGFLTDEYFEGLLIPCNCKLFATSYSRAARVSDGRAVDGRCVKRIGLEATPGNAVPLRGVRLDPYTAERFVLAEAGRFSRP